MTERQKGLFIQTELHHELRCLLGSATLWRMFQKVDAGYDTVVAADSAFMHARTLFEFFTSDAKNSNNTKVTEFGIVLYKSPLYSRWKESLNRHVLHLSHTRLNPQNIKGSGQLKDQVEAFAQEVLLLWDRLESDTALEVYKPLLTEARKFAIAHAAHDVKGRGNPIFTFDD